MAAMRLKEIEQATSVNESRAVMDFLPGPTAPDSDVPKALPWTAIKAWVKSLFPAALKNPQPLTFTGGGDEMDRYDGSAPKTVNIPQYPAEIGAAADAHTHVKANITDFPANLPNPHALSFTGGEQKTYNGSAAVSVRIPTALPNEHPLTFTGGATGSYNGRSPLEVRIPRPLEVAAPTGLELSYPASVSVRNTALQRIKAEVLPAFVLQDCVLFLPAGGYGIALQPDGTFRALLDVIDLYPDGTFRAKSVGTSRVYAIPTMAPGAYRVAEITVRPALLRRTGGGGIRRMSGGIPRIC